MSTSKLDVPPATPRREGHLRHVLLLGGLSAFAPLSIDMYLPALPEMAADLRAADATMQLTLTAFVVGLSVGQLVVGPLSDALGRRRPLAVGIVGYVLASVLCALSPSAEVLIVARALQAAGAAAAMVVARATVRDLYSGTAMTRFFSMLMLVTGLAPILAPVLGGQVLTWTSWRGVFVVLAGFGALLLLATLLALPEPLPAERRTPARLGRALRTYARLLRDRTFLGYALASGFVFAGMFAYLAGSSFVLQGVYGLTPRQYGLVFGLNALGLVLLGQVNGRIVGRVPERVLLGVGLFASAAGSLGMVLAAALGLGLAWLLPALFLVVASMGLVMPNSSSLALHHHAHIAGSAAALLGVLQFVVGGFAAPLVGLAGRGSAVPMTLVMLGFAVLALLAFATLTRREVSAPATA
ncbi:MFS transporter, DHA1 family, bicyclomycin/chloramphenicol resistance protein [Amycolatopsis arida]|uniref:MFS transporter, DHA1 family, bicyclomycin/chloramphenicol resistance protein n=1 Tax=Amycolatopsis arida TaxID=587909 RepID=A0A1I5KYU7_9PSEU|nr:Bcr/CflA family multidrug efflux MFS transporter [Amycolatopsis arida]TDX85870.1 DHA1 family bicyclomycin/chloramphenicol resistance-like MFS transporter [Amycolatopsis arida]SFO89641.1 MFS transporter, DHA1 family, bicyclomycin/chloramphenicol resistance protein [Amycolatopsis arida]